jgi:hypothetical protein
MIRTTYVGWKMDTFVHQSNLPRKRARPVFEFAYFQQKTNAVFCSFDAIRRNHVFAPRVFKQF